MDLSMLYTASENEKPLDRLVTDGGFCGIFRKIACIGDSLSSGEFQSLNSEGKVGYHDYFDYSWGQYLARMAGLTVYNFSRGGLTAPDYFAFAGQKGYFDIDKAAQGYVIALGVNDLFRIGKGELEFGDVSDIDLNDYKNNKKTFVGCYAAIIQKYKEIQPKAKFFLMTIPNNGTENPNADKHRDILYKLAEIFENTYVLDFRKYAPVYNDEFRKLFFLAGHMNAAGYLVTAQMVASYIDYIIRHNMDDFCQIGFVGTDNHNINYKW